MADTIRKGRRLNALAVVLLAAPLILFGGLVGLFTLDRLPCTHGMLKAAGISTMFEWIANCLGING